MLEVQSKNSSNNFKLGFIASIVRFLFNIDSRTVFLLVQ
jgi:hypothetical protein